MKDWFRLFLNNCWYCIVLLLKGYTIRFAVVRHFLGDEHFNLLIIEDRMGQELVTLAMTAKEAARVSASLSTYPACIIARPRGQAWNCPDTEIF